MNDLQIPWQDKPVVELVTRFVEDLKPHGVVLNGDIVDCYSLSEFSKNPLVDYTLAREAREAAALLHRLAKVSKERWWIGGNHEDRLRRAVWKNPEFSELNELQFPELFHLTDNGFRWKPYGGVIRLGKLLVTHGDMVNK